MPDPGERWDETDSETYRALLDVAVPGRAEQIAAFLVLLPKDTDDDAEHRIVELGCGTGSLSFAFLEAYPHCRVTALDGSESMLAHCRERLARFGDRVHFEPFDIKRREWLSQLDGANTVVSSLCMHHLDGKAKRGLFREAHRRLSKPGALLVADLVEPKRSAVREWFRGSWDRSVAESSRLRGGQELAERFRLEEWNYYRYPDPSDQPSPLSTQLDWLAKSGFVDVDCFWMQAGHAIFGGFQEHDCKLASGRRARGIAYERALEIADAAIEATR